MKTFIPFIVTLMAFSLVAEENAQPTSVQMPAKMPIELAVDIDKVSETLGHLLMRQLENPVIAFNIEKIIEGMKEERVGKAAPLTESEYESQVLLIQEKIFQVTAENNLNEANAFLQKNEKAEGVISFTPKLQYKIEAAGEGDIVTAEAKPLIHYTGKLLNGTVFATSRDSGTPIALSLKETIEGFKAIVGMKKGEVRTLYVHPELAYKATSVAQLPPNSLLIFEVEVVDIGTAEAQSITEAQSADGNNSMQP